VTVTHEVKAEYTVDPAKAVGALGKIAASAGRINSTFDKASTLLGSVASVGGSVVAAFSFEKIISTTKEHLGMIQRISTLTKTDVRSADALVGAFEDVGIEGETTERILLGMSRRASMMNLGMQGMNRTVGGTRGMFQRLGVDVRKGIEPALMKMSKLYKEGKVDVSELGTAFGVPRQQALDMVRLLEKGPGEIKKMIASGREFAIGDDTMAQFNRMRTASISAKDALQRMQIMVGSELMPVLAELMEDATKKIKEWLPEVKKFAVFLRENLHAALDTILKIGKVLLANYATIKATTALQALGMLKGAGGMGIGGLASKALGYVRGAPTGVAAATRVASTLVGFGASPASMAKALPMLGSVMRVVAMLGRLTALGVVIGFVLGAVQVIRTNFLGIKDSMLGFWNRLRAHVAVIHRLFAPVIQAFSTDGTIGKFFGTIIVTVIKSMMDMVERIFTTVEIIILWVSKIIDDPEKLMSPLDTLVEAGNEAAKMHRDALRKQAAEEKARLALDRATPKDRALNHYDFRNSRFSITQNFEEGFDPDRIALAFSNDLASLGEKKLMSGFSPLYAIR
jgi:hypothetical protein